MPEPTPAHRVENELAGALERTATARDADVGLPVAATVVLVRDGDDSPEVLLIERPDRGSFAGAWVFPGGKLEDADRDRDDETEEEVARRAGVRETREETGIIVDTAALVTLSVWNPPPGVALRIRTWFFVTPAAPALASDPAGGLMLSADEAVSAAWMRPADAIARHGRGELTLYPPTWVTLHALSEHADAASILDTARLAGVQQFETVARTGGAGPVLLWQDDAEYATDAGAAAAGSSARSASVPRSSVASARHRLEIGALPWVYTRST